MPGRYIIYLCLAFLCLQAAACSGRTAESDLAPQFVLKDSDGREVSSETYKGKIVLLEFFATWCEPCKYNAPHMQELYMKYRDRGVAFIAISLDEGARVPEKIKAFAKEYGITYPILIDNKNMTKKAYNAYALPTTFIINKEGRIVKLHYGITPKHPQKLAQELDGLLN